MKRIVALFFVILIIAGGGGYLVYSLMESEVETHVLTLYGNVDIRDVALAFRVSGRIAQMAFEEGDVVEKNAVVASLDKEPFIEELALREAELGQARAVLANAEKLYKRRSQLVKTGAASQNDYDEALAARDEARASVQTAAARIKLVRTSLDDTELLAPDNGTILTRVREVGAIVSAGAPVYMLALGNPVWVRTYVDEPDLGHVFPGQDATVSTDTGDRYEAQVGFISPQAEFTPKNVETTQLRTDLVYRMRVIVDNPDNGLRQGMPVTVEIDKRRAGGE